MSALHNPNGEKRFAQTFCILFVCFSAAVFVFKRTDLFPWIGACNAAGYDAEHYLAYCHSTRYGDYEHYAIYNALEPRAVDALKEAQVLFLGNSNTQFAFSTAAVAEFFQRKNVSHYVMGFGQGAQSPVAEAVMRKHTLQPQMIIANVDPFFSNETNGTFQRVLANQDALTSEHRRKRRLQHWQANSCRDSSHRFHQFLCEGQAETLYRNKQNGHWRTDYYRHNGKHPVTVSDDLLDNLEVATAVANQFIEQNNIRRDCIVLTVTPKTGTPNRFAQSLAARLQLPLIAPQLDRLVTIDHSHLDSDSAARWSAAFLEQVESLVDRCTETYSHAAMKTEE